MKSGSVPILLVEDNQADIEIIQRILRKGNINNPIHAVRDGETAIEFLKKQFVPFLVIILDVHLPGINGMEVLKEVMKLDPKVTVIMLTGQPSLQNAIESLRGGKAFDYIQKSTSDLPGLVEAVRSALENGTSLLKNDWIIENHGMNRVVNMLKVQEIFGLSNREVDLVKCLCRGNTNREIAEQLFISELTVKGHLKNIYHKMEIHNRAALVSKVLENTLIHS